MPQKARMIFFIMSEIKSNAWILTYTYISPQSSPPGAQKEESLHCEEDNDILELNSSFVSN